MALAQLISAERFASRPDAASWVVIDCRYSLDDPGYGRRQYQHSHLPGAYFLDLHDDLCGPDHDGQRGRHPLPEPEALLVRLRACGCHDDSQILLYDDGPGAFAAHLWWLLVWLGKRDGVWLLDGGFKAWNDAGLPLSSEIPAAANGTLRGIPDTSLLVEADDLLPRLNDPTLRLLDARAEPRFRGEQEPIDPVAGHIPGARCVPFAGNLGADGRFLAPEALRARFAPLLDAQAEPVAYCGSGVTACHNLFAISLAGYPLPRLYAPSWSGWISDPARPVARGD